MKQPVFVSGHTQIDAIQALSYQGARIVVWCMGRATSTGRQRRHNVPPSTSTSSATTCNSPSSEPVRSMGWKSGLTGFRVIRA
jgi:hypothetical protein